jgi:predicted dehydrogenase
VNVAVIGLGGQGKVNLDAVARAGERIVALCDVDDERAGDAYRRFPEARKFTDFRELFSTMERQIDAVVISTPDHTHFHPARLALSLGKHVYLEKPLAHTVWEVRELTNLARKRRVATQLGVQRHVLPAVRRAVTLVQAGAIGQVREVHAWIDSSRGMPPLLPPAPPVPDTLKYDLWLGPAKATPYSPELVPYKWRFWWEFGTGEAGNWGCHILDIPFWALGWKYPSRVNLIDGDAPDAERTPTRMHVALRFGKQTLHWYQGKPGILAEKGLDSKGMNNLFIGSEGMLLCGFDKVQLLPREKFASFSEPKESLYSSPGFHKEWLDACRGGTPASCNFDYSGPLTETVLLANVAYQAQGGFDWDARRLSARGNPKAEAFIRPHFRPGWE